jgi:hypothetical protein
MDRPLHQREILYTLGEVAQTIGVSRMSVYRYRKYYPDFPYPPVFRCAVLNWARRRELPRMRGPQPSHRRQMVVWMRNQGESFWRIAADLGISVRAVYGLWQRANAAD